MFTKTKLLLAAALATASLATSVNAGTIYNATSNPDVFSEKVSMAGLDLQTPAGAKFALQRIRAAAHDVCGVELDPRRLGISVRVKSCATSAIDHAVAEVGSPILTAMNASHGGARAQLAAEGR
jgi:UrcA family protein